MLLYFKIALFLWNGDFFWCQSEWQEAPGQGAKLDTHFAFCILSSEVFFFLINCHFSLVIVYQVPEIEHCTWQIRVLLSWNLQWGRQTNKSILTDGDKLYEGNRHGAKRENDWCQRRPLWGGDTETETWMRRSQLWEEWKQGLYQPTECLCSERKINFPLYIHSPVDLC